MIDISHQLEFKHTTPRRASSAFDIEGAHDAALASLQRTEGMQKTASQMVQEKSAPGRVFVAQSGAQKKSLHTHEKRVLQTIAGCLRDYLRSIGSPASQIEYYRHSPESSPHVVVAEYQIRYLDPLGKMRMVTASAGLDIESASFIAPQTFRTADQQEHALTRANLLNLSPATYPAAPLSSPQRSQTPQHRKPDPIRTWGGRSKYPTPSRAKMARILAKNFPQCLAEGLLKKSNTTVAAEYPKPTRSRMAQVIAKYHTK